ncbi:MAG: penicillin-binding protein 1C [Synergistaceae bacterium]|jgi:penicillin-binding protein 1C|nr:penicillin-binding protein 1C [Synergistaceae bacterium]
MEKTKSFRAIRFTALAASAIILALALFCLAYLEPNGIYQNNIENFAISTSVLDRDGRILSVYLSDNDEWCLPISLDKMGRWIAKAAVAVEDKRFYDHKGIDFLAIMRASYDNLRTGKIVSGASTITTQLIRISHPRPRTFMTKLIEFWTAIRIESRLNKGEILEMYLNRAPFGGNIRGVEAASMAYFNKNANALSLAESSLLISLVKSPSARRPDRYPEKARSVRDGVLKYLFTKNYISEENLKFALTEPVAAFRYPMPRKSAMASKHVLRNSNGIGVIKSTISSRYQQALENNLERAIFNLRTGITAAGVIVHNESGEILAYVGNARHGLSLPAAQVDCGDAPRSPGSALKPFVYARAFERGIITPASLLADTPISFSGNAPRNFDMTHRGAVSARTALAQSLNTPAVRVLRKLGYSDVRSLFGELGFSHVDKESGYYTDSLVLGGCEVSVLQLAAAYRGLAEGGIISNLKWTKEEGETRRKIFSSEASWLTGDILQDTRRLMPLYQQIVRDSNQKIAFKTGTSHGFRDAWVAGFSNAHTAVIWIGAPDGTPDARLVGLDLAAPIMLSVFNDIRDAGDGRIKVPPSAIFRRKVCALSGSPAGKYCPSIIYDYAIKDVSDVSLCDIHKAVDGHLITVLPKELDVWFQGRGRSDVPSSGVKITRPFKDRKILMQDTSEVSARVFLSAEGPLPHYWYLDGKFIASDTTGKGLFFEVLPGQHTIAVLSATENDAMEFEVITANADGIESDVKLLSPNEAE